MKKFFIIISVIAALVGLLIVFGEDSRHNDKPITFQLGEYEYTVPQNYFIRVPNPECHATVSTIEVLVPNFEPRTKETEHLFRVTGKEDTNAHMIMNDYIEGEEQLGHRIKSRLESVHKDGNGPKRGPDRRVIPKDKIIKPNNLIHDELELVELTYPKKRKYRKKTIYTDPAEENKTMIVCGDIGSVPTPHCNHYFTVNGLLAIINYHNDFLKQWSKIEMNARLHLGNWAVKKIDKQKPRCKEYMQDLIEGNYDGTSTHTN